MKSRMILAVIGFGFTAIIFGWFYETRLKSAVDPGQLAIPDNIDYYLTEFTVKVTNQQGNPDYQISSPKLEHRPKTDVSDITAPSMKIYREDGLWLVESDTGQLQHRDNLMKLQKNVIMRKKGDHPMQLETDSILFDPDHDLVTIDRPVTLRRKSATIVAQQAVFDLQQSIYTLEKTRAVYPPGNRDHES